ncbi:MAG: hypothetical protein E7431_04265 [Ruminococcaceae bacterium]|nr:hypothetical protein [Oscillospiraceae bacterium]
MKKRSVQRAYQNIRPDEESKARMLQNILLSSEIPPAGKDDTMKHKKMRPMVLVAIIAAAIMLMGSAVVVMSLRDVKIGEITIEEDILDSQGNVLIASEETLDYISLHGFINSPTYLAHQEWHEFYKEYSLNHVITKEENYYIPPEKYDAYNAYNQELQDKIEEIAAKYDLKLLGAIGVFQLYESGIFHEVTGVDSLLVSGSAAEIKQESGYFYEGGNFKVEFDMEMVDQENDWPYLMYNTFYYSRKDCFDDTGLNIGYIEFWDQWMYTTSQGIDVLIANSEFGTVVLCDKENSIIYVNINSRYLTDYNAETNSYDTSIPMSKEQLEKVVDQIDFGIEVESVNFDLAREQLEEYQYLD